MNSDPTETSTKQLLKVRELDLFVCLCVCLFVVFLYQCFTSQSTAGQCLHFMDFYPKLGRHDIQKVLKIQSSKQATKA